jgi:hypothetical protein
VITWARAAMLPAIAVVLALVSLTVGVARYIDGGRLEPIQSPYEGTGAGGGAAGTQGSAGAASAVPGAPNFTG